MNDFKYDDYLNMTESEKIKLETEIALELYKRDPADHDRVFLDDCEGSVREMLRRGIVGWQCECQVLNYLREKYPEQGWKFYPGTLHGYFEFNHKKDNLPDLINNKDETVEVKAKSITNETICFTTKCTTANSCYKKYLHDATWVYVVNLNTNKCTYFSKDYWLENVNKQRDVRRTNLNQIYYDRYNYSIKEYKEG